MTTTQQELLEFLKKLKPIPQQHIDELTDDFDFTLTKWKKRSKKDWKDIAGPANGIDIYNHLNPAPRLTNALEPATHVTPRKLLVTGGPVDPQQNLGVKFSDISWCQEVEIKVAAGHPVLLYGHWQSGKTSMLRHLERKYVQAGHLVCLIDFNVHTDSLKFALDNGTSFYRWLAERFLNAVSSNLLPDVAEVEATKLSNHEFRAATEFLEWLRSLAKCTTGKAKLPLLLFDEYDSLLKLACKHDGLLDKVNVLISSVSGAPNTLQSIVCAGTFLIVSSQDVPVDHMELDEPHNSSDDMNVEDPPKKVPSSGSLDDDIVSFDKTTSPWNKSNAVATQPFSRKLVASLAAELFAAEPFKLADAIVDDIFSSTLGHPGFTVWLLSKALSLAVDTTKTRNSLSMVDWKREKVSNFLPELNKTPTMNKMVQMVKKSRSLKQVVNTLVRLSQASCPTPRLQSFLIGVGVAREATAKHLHNGVAFHSPIIRDALLDYVVDRDDDLSHYRDVLLKPGDKGFLRSLILTATKYVRSDVLLDPLVRYAKGLAEPAVHAELYRIISNLIRRTGGRVLTETRVVGDSTQQCDLWLFLDQVREFGIEIKTELGNEQVQACVTLQASQYVKSRCPLGMMVVSFVWQEDAAVKFPIDITPTGWNEDNQDAFDVLFIRICGTADTKLTFSYAGNKDTKWTELPSQ